MARGISTPPKERINITYQPDGDAKEDIELPFKLMMVGDYTQRSDKTPLKERKPILIKNKEDFSKAMKKYDLSLSIDVKNTLTEETIKNGDELNVKLTFEKIQHFRPDSIAEQVPELKKLLRIREAFKALRAPLGSEYEFRKAIENVLDSKDLDKLLNDLS